MVATAHLGRQQQSARHFLKALALLRQMDPDPSNPSRFRINWGAVATTTLGGVAVLLLTSALGGVAYVFWRLPAQQDKIIQNQAQMQGGITGLAAELKRLEENDRIQDGRLIRLESR